MPFYSRFHARYHSMTQATPGDRRLTRCHDFVDDARGAVPAENPTSCCLSAALSIGGVGSVWLSWNLV